MKLIKNKLINLFQKLYFWAFLVTIIIFIFIPKFSSKYKIVQKQKDIYFDTQKNYYNDIDNNGISERIEVNLTYGYHRISVFSQDNILIYELNLVRNLNKENIIQFNDYNHNGKSEIYFLTNSQDSVFLNIVEFGKKLDTLVYNKLITKISNNKRQKYDYGTYYMDFADLDKDGFDEYCFYICGNFSYSPRQIFSYNLVKKELNKTEDLGAHISNPTIFCDQNNDSYILAGSSATDNYKSALHPQSFPDTSAWFFVFDKDLKPIFKPVNAYGAGSYVEIDILKFENKNYFIALFQNYINNKVLEFRIYDFKGNELNKKLIPENYFKGLINLWRTFKIENNNELIYFYDFEGNIFTIDFNLEINKIKSFANKNNKITNLSAMAYDINSDGNQEFMFSTNDNLIITDSHFENQEIFFTGSFGTINNTLKLNNDKSIDFSFSDSFRANWYVINYTKNKLYYLSYTIYFVIFLVTWLILYLSQILRFRILEQENIKLNSRVEKRTNEIEKQNVELKNLHLFKNDMVNMLVHDLKNSINGIINFKEKDRINQEAGAMNIIINNILDTNKLNESKMQINKTQFKLNNIINIAYERVEFLINSKYIRFENKIDYQIIMETDELLLERILINLLNNAAKFSPLNSTITIDYEIDEENKLLKINIIDQGNGIEKDIQEKIFEKFYYSQNDLKGFLHSTGIGLTFCKTAIKAMNGEIGVVSEPQKGSEFWFTLNYLEIQDRKIITKNYNKNITNEVFNDEEIKLLEPYLLKLSKIEIYEISEQKDVLLDLKNTDNQKIKDWIKKLERIVSSFDKVNYAKMTDINFYRNGQK